MSIIAVFDKQFEVEVQDVYTVGGVKLASVKAVEGKPFVGGDKWPIRTEYGTVRADLLTPAQPKQEPQPEPAKAAADNLLARALAASKPTWYAGESVWVWRAAGPGKRGAFLKEEQGFINLCLAGKQASCTIFWLDPITWRWEVSKTVEKEYREWVQKVQKEVAR